MAALPGGTAILVGAVGVAFSILGPQKYARLAQAAVALACLVVIGVLFWAFASGDDIESDPPQNCYQMHVVNLDRPPGEREFSFTFNAQNDEPLEVEKVPAPGTWSGGEADSLALEYDDKSKKWNFLACLTGVCSVIYTMPGVSKTAVPPAGTWISPVQLPKNEEVTGSRLTCQ